eukprot:6429314-Amphidinium_carterae.1
MKTLRRLVMTAQTLLYDLLSAAMATVPIEEVQMHLSGCKLPQSKMLVRQEHRKWKPHTRSTPLAMASPDVAAATSSIEIPKTFQTPPIPK